MTAVMAGLLVSTRTAVRAGGRIARIARLPAPSATAAPAGSTMELPTVMPFESLSPAWTTYPNTIVVGALLPTL